MKYYEMHEIVYRHLQNQGVLSWDKSKTYEEVWLHSTNIFLDKFLTKREISFDGLQVLDLGTGTGTSALFAAKHGATVAGVEISRSAISIAKDNAKNLGLNIEFIAGDVLELELNRKFNLVVDSTILHCIVGFFDRKKFYDTVRRHMDEKSYFMVNTMIATENMSSRFPEEHFLFQDNILWSLGLSEIADRKFIDGKSYFPHRTLLSESKQLEEFKINGFEVIEMEKISDRNRWQDLVALLRVS